jgi:hypothetical protein
MLAGCGVTRQTQGVMNKWRDKSIAPFETGQTTQSDVIAQLGPPSQVIALNDGVVYYYMRELVVSKGLFLIVYNVVRKQVSYDRAIFFFNSEGILTDYGYSAEQIPNEKAP